MIGVVAKANVTNVVKISKRRVDFTGLLISNFLLLKCSGAKISSFDDVI